MNIYTIYKINDNEIELKKFNIDLSDIFEKENGNKILKKINRINITNHNELINYEFKSSQITKCKQY